MQDRRALLRYHNQVMCYSAQVEQNLKLLARRFDARIDTAAFADVLEQRLSDPSIRVGKALEANFVDHRDVHACVAGGAIEVYRERRVQAWQEELFAQRRRLVAAERKLAVRETKTAREQARIAQAKIAQRLGWLADFERTTLLPRDARIYPFWYAPVIVAEGEDLVIRPMRYHCRPAGKPAAYDRRYPGLYNARRDKLEGFWKSLFGHRHAIVAMESFFENVARHDYEHRALALGETPENLVLQFAPDTPQGMLVACLWDRWEGEGKGLESFAAITDEPPAEIATTGHERCIIPLKPEHVRAWLMPQGRSLPELYALLDDRERPTYAHRVAA